MASGSRHLSRIRGTAAGRSSKDTGQAARIRELTARLKNTSDLGNHIKIKFR